MHAEGQLCRRLRLHWCAGPEAVAKFIYAIQSPYMAVVSSLEVVRVDFVRHHASVPENLQDIALDSWEHNFVVDMSSCVCDQELLWTPECTV